jgi:Tfp pilus assembly protein PilN
MGVSAVLLGMIIIHLSQQSQLNTLESRLEAIRTETDLYRDKIAVVEDLTVKRADVSSRIDVIRELDKNRFARVEVLEMLARRIPSLTWLTEVKESSDTKRGWYSCLRRYQLEYKGCGIHDRTLTGEPRQSC